MLHQHSSQHGGGRASQWPSAAIITSRLLNREPFGMYSCVKVGHLKLCGLRPRQRSIRGEGEEENERDKAMLFHVRESCWQMKEDREALKNVLGAFSLFFSEYLPQCLLFLLLLINSPSHTPKLSVYQPPSRSPPTLFISISSPKARLKHS